MQNSFTTGCYVEGDNRFNTNLINDQENNKKSDLKLDKRSEILPALKDKLFLKDCNRKDKFEDRQFNRSKKQATKSRNVIEEKLQENLKLKSSSSFEQPNYNLPKKQTKSENKFQESEKVNFASELKFQESLKVVKNCLSEENLKYTDALKNTSKHKLKNENNNLKIFASSDDLSSCSSHSNLSDKLSIKKENNEKKYSWQDIKSWLSPSQKEEINEKQKSFDCKKTYSWEIVGIGTQISDHFLQNDIPENKSTHECSIKYSWQIIGKGTQVSLNDYKNNLIFNDDYRNNSFLENDYWQGSIIFPRKGCGSLKKFELQKQCIEPLNQVRILYCEGTQTSSDKKTQTERTNCRTKYSWENLIKLQLDSLPISKNNIKQISYDNCIKHSRPRINPIKCSTKYSWENLISQHLKL